MKNENSNEFSFLAFLTHCACFLPFVINKDLNQQTATAEPCEQSALGKVSGEKTSILKCESNGTFVPVHAMMV